ncbi:DUF6750 family protein [Photorhabdus asymbiotica]|uniref:DUF6750 family protein n=1 Tax=Photorhabdus asymbiotica TaxID=291112 RepID=UPI003DA79120
MLTTIYNIALKIKVAMQIRKYQLMGAISALLLASSPAHAEGDIWEIVRSWGDGMKSIREPIFWISGTVGIFSIISGLIIIKNVNDAKRQGQNSGRSVMTGVWAIVIGAALVGLASFIKISTKTAGVESSI